MCVASAVTKRQELVVPMSCAASCREGEGSRGGELGGAEGEHLCNV